MRVVTLGSLGDVMEQPTETLPNDVRVTVEVRDPAAEARTARVLRTYGYVMAGVTTVFALHGFWKVSR